MDPELRLKLDARRRLLDAVDGCDGGGVVPRPVVVPLETSSLPAEDSQSGEQQDGDEDKAPEDLELDRSEAAAEPIEYLMLELIPLLPKSTAERLLSGVRAGERRALRLRCSAGLLRSRIEDLQHQFCKEQTSGGGGTASRDGARQPESKEGGEGRTGGVEEIRRLGPAEADPSGLDHGEWQEKQKTQEKDNNSNSNNNNNNNGRLRSGMDAAPQNATVSASAVQVPRSLRLCWWLSFTWRLAWVWALGSASLRGALPRQLHRPQPKVMGRGWNGQWNEQGQTDSAARIKDERKRLLVERGDLQAQPQCPASSIKAQRTASGAPGPVPQPAVQHSAANAGGRQLAALAQRHRLALESLEKEVASLRREAAACRRCAESQDLPDGCRCQAPSEQKGRNVLGKLPPLQPVTREVEQRIVQLASLGLRGGAADAPGISMVVSATLAPTDLAAGMAGPRGIGVARCGFAELTRESRNASSAIYGTLPEVGLGGAMAPMKPVQTQVKAIFEEALRSAFPSVQQEAVVVKGNPKFGDYQCNNAMGLFREHGAGLGFKNPGEIAEAIKNALPANKLIGAITVAAQGFVTVKLSESWVADQVSLILEGEVEYLDPPRKR
ncbi:unnamed protein product, partial [Polarella glacialis]